MKVGFSLGILCLILSGCATIIRGTSDQLQITSKPEGAQANLSNGQTCTTPCSLTLPRDTSVVINFAKAGCDEQMTSVYPTLAGAGVVLGGIIDYGTGAVYNLTPNPVVVALKCSAAITDVPAAAVPASAVKAGSSSL